MLLGLDIGGTSVKVSLLADGTPVADSASETYLRPDAEELASALRTAVGRLGGLFDPTKISGVGLCVPGMLDEASGVITGSVNVPGLVGTPLRTLLERAIRVSPPALRFCTDAHAAALDVIATERPVPQGRLMAISLGTGVGACVLDDGKPLLVSGRSSGHFGQIDVTIHEAGREAPIGPDGGRGGLEAYIGLPALVRRLGCTPDSLREKLSQDRVPLLALARGIRIAHAIYRPQHVRLLGGIGIQLGEFVEFLRMETSQKLTSLARDGWTLSCGTSPFHAARGAARFSGENPR